MIMIKQFSDMVTRGMMTAEEAKILDSRYRKDNLMKNQIAIPEPKQRQDTRQWLLTVPARYSKTKKRHQITRNSREAVIAAWVDEVSSTVTRESLTVYDLITEFIEDRRCEMRQTSLDTYVGEAATYIKDTDFGDCPLSAVTVDTCRHYMQSLYRQGLSHGTITRIKSITACAMDYGIAHGYMATNCMRIVKINENLCSQAAPRACGAWSDEEISLMWQKSLELWNNGRKFRFSAGIMLLIYTGLRIGELLAATWEDVDFEERTLTVEKSAIWSRGGCSVSSPKTATSNRTIALNDMAIFWLEEIRRRNTDMGIESDLILPTQTGHIAYTHSVNLSLKTFCEHCGVRYLASHSARRTYASVLIDAHIPVSEVSHDLGHKNITVTQNSYYKRRNAQATQLQRKTDAFAAGLMGLTDSNTQQAAAI